MTDFKKALDFNDRGSFASKTMSASWKTCNFTHAIGLLRHPTLFANLKTQIVTIVPREKLFGSCILIFTAADQEGACGLGYHGTTTVRQFLENCYSQSMHRQKHEATQSFGDLVGTCQSWHTLEPTHWYSGNTEQ